MANLNHPGQPASAEIQRHTLGRAAQLLASATDFSDTLRQTIDACLPDLGDFGFFDAAQDGQVRRTSAAHQAPDIQALLAATQWVRQERVDLNLCALSSGRSALHAPTDDRWYQSIALDPGHLALLRQLAASSMITVPMRYQGDVVGALTLFMGRSGRQHTAEQLALAEDLALLAAPVVANARLLEQQRNAEAALRVSEERLRMAVEAGQVGIWDWDIIGNQITWSDRIYQMHQMVPGSDTGGVAGFRERVHPDDLPRVEEAIRAALAGGSPYAVDFRSRLPDGRIRWISTRSHLVRDSQGQPIRMVGTSTDVTERVALLAAEQQARSEAESARRRLELLASAGAVLSGSLDPQDTLAHIANTIVPGIADWCRIDLIDEDGVLQRRLAYHQNPQRAEAALAMARQLRAAASTTGSLAWVIETGRSHSGRFDSPEAMADPALRLYTQTFGMHANFIIPLVARGRTIGAMAVVQAESGRDLGDDDRSLIQELGHRAALALDNSRLYAAAEAARRQAESANRAKDEFLAMLGHELRNPVAPIVTALDLMARRDDTVNVEERRLIGRQVAHLSRLIDDLLDVSRITQGKIQMRREAVDLRTVIAHAVELTQPVFGSRKHSVELRLSEGQVPVLGDSVRLTQVVCNLLVNAAKFTPPEGRVLLTLRVEGELALVSVEDSGCGIGSELLPKVFDLFVQGRQSIDRQSGGLGLGLAIVRRLVEIHGGTVSAASDGPGRGSRFEVRLPVTFESTSGPSAPAPAALPVGSEPAAGGRVLVVDDNSDAAETLADLLQMVGYETRTAGDGEAALALLGNWRPDLALLDIGLPGIDGYQLAALLRADARVPGLQLVALTGYGRDNDRALALASGFNEHLVKPVQIDRLLLLLRQLLGPPA